jgi:cytoskeletal protein RodZ
MSETTNENNNETVELSSAPCVGDQLRSLREGKGYSLKYISQQTKISVRILENIESSNFKELPNKTYVTGFLRSYCRILGADADTFINSYANEADQNANQKTSRKKSNDDEFQSVSQKQVMAVMGLIIVAGVFVGIFKFIGNVSDNEPQVRKENESIQLETITASTPLAKEEKQEAAVDAQPSDSQRTDTAATTEPNQPPAEPKVIGPAPEQTSLIDQKKKLDQDQLASAEEKKKLEALQAKKTAEEKAAKEKADKLAAEKAAKAKAEKEKADKLAADKAAKAKAEKEKADKAAKAKAEKEKADKLAADKAAKAKAEKEKLAKEKAEKEKAAAKVAQKEEDKKKKEEVEFTDFQLPLYQYDTVDVDDIPEAELPKTYRQSVIKGKQNIFINALDGDTWITYKSDDQKVKKFVLKQGRRILIRGEVIRLFMGNINVAKMFLNNRPLIVQSKSGVRSLVFPQELSMNYKIPLFIYKKDGTVETSEDFLSRQQNEDL